MPEELAIIEAVGSTNLSYSISLEKINRTAIEKLKGIAQTKVISQAITHETYQNMQAGFTKILETEELKDKIIDIMNSNDVNRLKLILSNHPDLITHPFFASLFLLCCQKLEIAQLLIDHGLKFDFPDDFNQQMIKNLVNKNEFSLLDFYIKQGLPSVFTIDKTYSISIEFVGCVSKNIEDTISGKGSVSSYLNYPHIKKALHEFVNKSLNLKAIDDFNIIMNHYTTYGDKEGISEVMLKLTKNNQKKIKDHLINILKDYLLNAIGWGHISVIEKILAYVPLSRFSDEARREMYNLARSLGYIHIENLLSKGVELSTKEQEDLAEHQHWFNGGAEREFPQLKHYLPLERTLNPQHIDLYGGNSVQDKYRSYQRENVFHALSKIKMLNECLKSHTRSSGLFVQGGFRELLISLGRRRGHIAAICGSPTTQAFGQERDTHLITVLAGSYQKYDALLNSTSKKTEITLGNKSVILSELRRRSPKETGLVANVYDTFFQTGDPVYQYVADIYGKIATSTFSSPEALGKEISKLHWHLAHISPFIRGSASIAEVITDALWLYHGYLPQPIEAGKSLDLEAMFSPSLEAYQASYPVGKASI